MDSYCDWCGYCDWCPLYQNWDTVRAKAGELWSAISEKWSQLVDWTKQTWNDMGTAISEAWDLCC